MMYRTVLCDLDGTLIDSSREISAAFRYALSQTMPGDLPEPAAIVQHIGKPLARMTLELGYRLSPSQLTRFLNTYRRYYDTHGAVNIRAYPGVIETLRALTANIFGVVTTKAPHHAQAALDHLKMADFFHHVQGTTPNLLPKPAPDTILEALNVLRCDPEHALMVGDTAGDIWAGQAAGVKTCAVSYGFGDLDELNSARPDYWIASFNELINII
jgi:phosphoglycolate phosphatase